MERAAPTRPLVGLRLQVSGKSGSSQLCEHGRKGAPRECGCAGRWGGPELTRLHQSDHTYSYSYKGSSHCLCNSRDHRQQTLTAQSTPRSVLVTLSRNRQWCARQDAHGQRGFTEWCGAVVVACTGTSGAAVPAKLRQHRRPARLRTREAAAGRAASRPCVAGTPPDTVPIRLPPRVLLHDSWLPASIRGWPRPTWCCVLPLMQCKPFAQGTRQSRAILGTITASSRLCFASMFGRNRRDGKN